MSAMKYKDGIFDRNSFIPVYEVHYWGLDEVFTHVLGWDVALSQVETYLRVGFHSRDKVLKKPGSKLLLLRVLFWLESTSLERTPN